MNAESVIRLDRLGYGDAVVYIDGELLSPQRSLRAIGLSQRMGRAYFNFGYPGRGVGQLALALLIDAGLSDTEAKQMRNAFKFDVFGWTGH